MRNFIKIRLKILPLIITSIFLIPNYSYAQSSGAGSLVNAPAFDDTSLEETDTSRLAGIFGELAKQTVKTGISKYVSKILDEAIDRRGLQKFVSNRGDLALKISKRLQNSTYSKIGGGFKFSGNVLMSLLVDVFADVLMKEILSKSSTYGKTATTIAAATTWVGVKQVYIYISSGGNHIKIAVGEALLLYHIAEKNVEAINEYYDTKEMVKRSQISNKFYNVLFEYYPKYIKEKHGTKRAAYIREIYEKFAVLRQETGDEYFHLHNEMERHVVDSLNEGRKEYAKNFEQLPTVTPTPNPAIQTARKQISEKSQTQQKVIESLKANTQKLESLSKQINTNQSKIRLLEKELASLSGSSNSSSRISQAQIRIAKIRELRLKMFWNLYNKYDGDISKISPNDKIRLYTLAKSFDGNWEELFVDSPALYESAKQERIRLVSASNGSGSDTARTLQNKIDNLKTKVTILANAARKKETERRSLFTEYQSNQNELTSLISDINDTAKEDIASSNSPALTNPFYGNVSYLGNGATTETFEGYFAASTSNDFSSSNQNTSFRAGDANEFITPNINTGSGNHFTDGYQYVAWGQWNSNGHQIVEGTDTNNALGGYWVLGQQAYNIPPQGTATYSGDMKGDYINVAGNAERGAIGGTIGFNVDFSQNTIRGNGSLTLHNSPLDTFSFNPVNLGNVPSSDLGGIDTSHWFYTNQVNTGSGQNMNIAGSLNGNRGGEMSGGFQWGEGNANSANSASGIFRAQCTGGACQ